MGSAVSYSLASMYRKAIVYSTCAGWAWRLPAKRRINRRKRGREPII
jgi:hypothetical protein